MDQEELNSYLITKTKILEQQVVVLHETLETLINTLLSDDSPTMEEAMENHRNYMSLVANRAVLDEKHRLGRLLFTAHKGLDKS